MTRTNISSGTEWEALVGYSRAVRTGPHIRVAGTTATNLEGKIVDSDAGEQTRQCISNIEAALKRLDASLADVVRTRVYVKNIDDWEAVGAAHRESFAEILPASTMIEISRFIVPEILVEIEAEAYAEAP